MLPIGLAHDTPHRLNNINLRVTGRQKQHRIQGGHVNTFGQTAHIAQDTAYTVLNRFLQPVELAVFLASTHTPIDVFCFTCQTRLVLDSLCILIRLNHSLEHLGNGLGTYLVSLLAYGRLDHLAESHCALHWLGRFFCSSLLQTDLGQRLPAADDLGCIVNPQLVVFVFQKRLQLAIDVTLLHRKHNHLIINQKVPAYRFRKRNDMQLLSIQGFVVHGVECNGISLCDRLGIAAIYSWCRSHIQTLGGLYVGSIVHPDKSTFVIPFIGRPCCSMRLVADDQVKVFQSVVMLRLVDDINGMIGTENHRHVFVIMPFLDVFSQTFAVCRSWIRQFMHQHLDGAIVLASALLAYIAVRANCKAM